MRKPVGMTAITETVVGETREKIYVVCDDGTVWYLEYPHLSWFPGATIPGTQAAEAPGSN